MKKALIMFPLMFGIVVADDFKPATNVEELTGQVNSTGQQESEAVARVNKDVTELGMLTNRLTMLKRELRDVKMAKSDDEKRQILERYAHNLAVKSLDSIAFYQVGDKVDFSDINGEAGKGIIVEFGPQSFSIMGEHGGSTIDYSQLTAEEKSFFKNAANYETPPPQESLLAANQPADKILLGTPIIKITDEDDTYVTFGWMVPVTNNTDHDIANLVVKLSCRDEDGVELDSFVCYTNAVRRGRTIQVTTTSFLNRDLKPRIARYVTSYTER